MLVAPGAVAETKPADGVDHGEEGGVGIRLRIRPLIDLKKFFEPAGKEMDDLLVFQHSPLMLSWS